MPSTVTVNGCEGDECQFIKGDTVSFKIDFTSPADADDLTLSVLARVFGTWQKWGAAPKQVCGSSVDCPLKTGSTYTYKFETKVLDEYPSIKTRVKYSLKSTTGDEIFCFTFPVSIQ